MTDRSPASELPADAAAYPSTDAALSRASGEAVYWQYMTDLGPQQAPQHIERFAKAAEKSDGALAEQLHDKVKDKVR